ncbi:MAG TPA: glycosyltransferase [Gemmatimonadales bacterium]|nr:glycosyltransferase [Gemmatimonadales bacterium]
MRILSVTHDYPRHDGDLAGAFIERLLVALRARGHAVEVVTPADGGAGGRVEARGVSVTRVRYAPARWEMLAHRGTMASAVRSPVGLLALTSLIAGQARAVRAARRTAPPLDVVHAHWWIPGGISAWLAHAPGGPPYVVTLHGTDVAVLGKSAPARALARRVLRRAASVTAVSGYLADRAAAATGIPRASIVVQPMPLETARLARVSAGGAGIVAAGRLTAQKRVTLIVDALAALKRRGRHLSLGIVGDGPERRTIADHAAALGVAEQVRFGGAFEPARVAEAVGDADVFAFAAEGEGFGLAAAEALALGVPVVAMESGGIADVVPRSGPGRLVPDGDVEAFAAALDELAAWPDARRLAAELGARLKRQLSPEGVAERFESVYRGAVSGVRRA